MESKQVYLIWLSTLTKHLPNAVFSGVDSVSTRAGPPHGTSLSPDGCQAWAPTNCSSIAAPTVQFKCPIITVSATKRATDLDGRIRSLRAIEVLSCLVSQHGASACQRQARNSFRGIASWIVAQSVGSIDQAWQAFAKCLAESFIRKFSDECLSLECRVGAPRRWGSSRPGCCTTPEVGQMQSEIGPSLALIRKIRRMECRLMANGAKNSRECLPCQAFASGGGQSGPHLPWPVIAARAQLCMLGLAHGKGAVAKRQNEVC